MDVLRTPDERFENLPDYDFEPHYVDVVRRSSASTTSTKARRMVTSSC